MIEGHWFKHLDFEDGAQWMNTVWLDNECMQYCLFDVWE